MAMKVFRAAFVLCLLASMAGNAFSSGDLPESVGIVGDRMGSDLFSGLGQDLSSPACGCPDLAYTEPFKAKGLGYVATREFAEAVHAVASGNSRYSPREIPPGWQAAEADWRRYLAAHPYNSAAEPARPRAFMTWLDAKPFFGKEACSPALLYLASLEYRSMPGHQGVTPAFPRLVRTAAFELGTQVVDKSRMAGIYAKRIAAMGVKIAGAERMGAEERAPRELARANSELDRARMDATGVRSGIQETEASFARAEQTADTLLGNATARVQGKVQMLSGVR
jgi:hypothetical protein